MCVHAGPICGRWPAIGVPAEAGHRQRAFVCPVGKWRWSRESEYRSDEPRLKLFSRRILSDLADSADRSGVGQWAVLKVTDACRRTGGVSFGSGPLLGGEREVGPSGSCVCAGASVRAQEPSVPCLFGRRGKTRDARMGTSAGGLGAERTGTSRACKLTNKTEQCFNIMKSKSYLKFVIGSLMVFVFADLAFAFYNPQQGRWLSRDPIGVRGGRNLYSFPGNAPIGNFDHLGLMGCRSRICCCCVDDLQIQNILKRNTGGEYGHYFAVHVGLTYKQSINNGQCAISWKEWSDRPPEGEAPPQTWYDVWTGIDSPAKDIWNRDLKNAPCPGKLPMDLPDEPSAWLDKPPRTLFIKIKVQSTPGCLCSYSSKTVCVRQKLYADNGIITIQKLDPVDCWTIPPDPEDPILGPPYP